jgi:hypothetical protein
VRLVPVLGYDERAAIGAVAAVLGRVLARMELQLAGLGAGKHSYRIAAGAEMEIGQANGSNAEER